MLGPRGIVVAGEVEPVPPLEVVPAEVRAAKRLAALEVDLLPAVLADVADHDAPLVEGEPERVSQAERVDLVAAGLADVRVALRDAVRLLALSVRVDPQQLAEQDVAVLRVLVRVAAAAAVPGRQVEVAPGPNASCAAVVVGEGRVRDHDHPRRDAAGPGSWILAWNRSTSMFPSEFV